MKIEHCLEKLRNISQGAKFICMFSGGKDSGLSLAKASQNGQAVALIHILIDEYSLYHEQEKKVIEAQARLFIQFREKLKRKRSRER